MEAATEPSLLGGRFEIRGTLGAGGAGIVYRAFDRQLQREVALKQLRTASGRDLFRFKREFRSLADITHPNLVALYELHAVAGEWFFTMELVEGVSFIDWVRPGEAGPQRARHDVVTAPLDLHRLRTSMIQLVDALLTLHDAKKLHRDLKPSNVLVAASGRLSLLDFGLVAGLAEGEPERLAVGTPVYMSPEQAADLPLDEASDWYSVGAMLYEGLTGRRPFEGTSEQVMTRKQTELPPHPTVLATGVPIELARLAMSLLQPTPAARPTGYVVLEQLGAAPSARTRHLARSQPPPIFVGRAEELDVLRGALGEARRRGVAVLVKGRSGLGKSTLVRRFVKSLGEGAIFLQGRCFEREAVPFKMLDGVVDSLTAAIMRLPPASANALAPRELAAMCRLFPVLRRVPRFAELVAAGPTAGGAFPAAPNDPQEMRRRGFQALRQMIGRLARQKPVVLFVDDAHWGDADSAVFVADLIHGSEPLPGLLVIVAHRPEDYLGVVASLRRAPGGSARRGDIRELEIAALSEGDAGALVTQLSSALGNRIDDGHTAAVVAAAGGNPLVLTEMARTPDRGAQGGTLSIEQLVRARVLRLSPDAQAMLAVSSIAARPIPIAIAAHAAGIVGGHDVAAVLSAERLATLRGVGDEMIVHPAHDYVRVAVLTGLDVEGKASWHEALARAFEAVQGAEHVDSQAVVEHWLAAGHPANAAEHAVTAAQRAEEALAFLRAAELYQIALAYGPWDAMGQRDLLRRQAHALTCAGQLDEAAAIYGHAAQLLPDTEAIDLDRLRVESLLRRGRLDEALPAAERLLAQIGFRIPLRASRTRLATQWAQMKLRGDKFTPRAAADIPADQLLAVDVLYSIASGLAFADPALGRVVQSELMRAALDAGEPFRVCLALAQEVCYAAAGGTKNRLAVEGVGRRLAALAAEIDHPHVRGVARLSIGLAAHMAGRWRDARVDLEAGLETLREYGTGVRWELDIGESYWLATLFYLGDWREMSRLVLLHLRDAIDRGDVVAQQNLRTGRTNLAWLVVDRPDEAIDQLAMAERWLGPTYSLQHAQTAMAHAHVALYRGLTEEAARRIEDALPLIDKLGMLRFQLPRIELGLLRARIALSDETRAIAPRIAEARMFLDALTREGAPWVNGVVDLLRASAATLVGDVASALGLLTTAEEQLSAAHMVGHVQLARLRRGELEGGAIGTARAAASRDLLKDLGAVDPDRLAQLLVPMPA